MTSIEIASAEPEAWFKLDRKGRTLNVGGAWTIAESAWLDRELNALELGGGDPTIDASKISRLDSAGAWLLLRTRRAMEEQGGKISRFDLPELYQPLIENIDQKQEPENLWKAAPCLSQATKYRLSGRSSHFSIRRKTARESPAPCKRASW